MECFRNLTPLHSMVTTHMIILIHPLALSYMNGLITCIHSPMPHQLCWCSVNVDMTFWGYSGRWWTPIVQVYSVPGVINLPALSSPADHGRVYMRDFSVQQPALDDVSPTSSRRTTSPTGTLKEPHMLAGYPWLHCNIWSCVILCQPQFYPFSFLWPHCS